MELGALLPDLTCFGLGSQISTGRLPKVKLVCPPIIADYCNNTRPSLGTLNGKSQNRYNSRALEAWLGKTILAGLMS